MTRRLPPAALGLLLDDLCTSDLEALIDRAGALTKQARSEAERAARLSDAADRVLHHLLMRHPNLTHPIRAHAAAVAEALDAADAWGLLDLPPEPAPPTCAPLPPPARSSRVRLGWWSAARGAVLDDSPSLIRFWVEPLRLPLCADLLCPEAPPALCASL